MYGGVKYWSVSLLLLQLAFGWNSPAEAKSKSRTKTPWKIRESFYGMGRLRFFNGTWKTGKIVKHPEKLKTEIRDIFSN